MNLKWWISRFLFAFYLFARGGGPAVFESSTNGIGGEPEPRLAG